MKNRLLTISCIFLITSACNPLKEKLQGGWVVDQAYYHNQPVRWDLYSNGFSLNEDLNCELPIVEWSDRNTENEKGTWKAYQKNDSIYLDINTENRIFNRTFNVISMKKVRDPESGGFLMKMTLSSDSLKMDCTKALY